MRRLGSPTDGHSREQSPTSHALQASTCSPEALAALWARAREASADARFADLERLMTEAVAMATGIHGELHPETARALNELAYALRRQGDYRRAEPVLRRLIAIQESIEGPDHPSLGLLLDLLAAAVSRVHPERMSEVKKLESRAAHLRLRRR